MPVDPDRQLPTDGRLPVPRWLTKLDSGKVQGAAGAAVEAGPVQEDAGSVHDSRIGPAGVGEDALGPRFPVELEPCRLKCGGQSADEPGLVLVPHLSAYRAAPLAKLGRRLGQDAEAPAAPEAGPVRPEELDVKAPDNGTVLDLFDRHAHRFSLLAAQPTAGQRSTALAVLRPRLHRTKALRGAAVRSLPLPSTVTREMGSSLWQAAHGGGADLLEGRVGQPELDEWAFPGDTDAVRAKR